MEVKVSVVIPVYNAEKYLVQCLESVKNQTLKDIQIICVNDGSTDKSLDIINEYAQNDSRFVVINQKNCGCGKAYNVGMAKADGEFIGFVEPDDYISDDMYETLYKVAKLNDIDFVKSDFAEFNSQGETNYRALTYSKEYYNKVINPKDDLNVFNFAMNTWTGLYKREFLEKNDINYHETAGASFQDNGFWFKTFCFADKVYFLDKAFYNYRIDNPNSSVNDPNKVFCMKIEYDLIYSFLNKNRKLKEKFKYIYQLRRFKNYKFSYKRIAQKYKLSFLRVFANDLKEAERRQEIDKSLFRKDELREMFLIKHFPLLYFIFFK